MNSQTRKGKVYEVSITVNGGITLEIALAVAFGVLIFVVVALIVAFCVWKRRNPAYLQVVRMPDGTGKIQFHIAFKFLSKSGCKLLLNQLW